MQRRLEHVVRLGAHAHGFAEGSRADGREHELLQVYVRVGVGATVQHVHARQRERVGIRTAHVAVERKVTLVRAGFGDRERHTQQGIGAETGFVVRAVERDERVVDQPLIEALEADDRLGDLPVDVRDGPLHTLAAVAVAAVPKLDGLVGAGAGPARNRRPPPGAREELDLDLDGRVASRVEYLSRHDVDDGAHSPPNVMLLWTECRM